MPRSVNVSSHNVQESGAPLPIEQLRNRQSERKKKLETPLGPTGSGSIPRSRRDSITSSTHPRAVTAVLLGAQGAGLLLGVPMIAHAQETTQPQSTTDATEIASRLRTLESSRNTLSPDALSEARRALWSSFVSSGIHGEEAPSILAESDSTSFEFEKRWTTAADGSVDAVEAQKAIDELGDQATKEKLIATLEQFASKLADSGRDVLRASTAGVMIRDAAADGTITASELTTIEASMAEKFGAEGAQKALFRAFPSHIGKFADGAAAHLLERIGSAETHVARLQSIVDEMLDGKQKLFDANFDGKIDAKDLVFTKTDDGKVTVEAIGQKVADQAIVAKAMVDASYKLNSSGISFQLIKNHKANPDFWNVTSSGVLELKPGVKASDAMLDIYANGSKYGFECATGLVAVYYQAMLDVLGPKDFDRVASDLRLGPWVMEDDLEQLMTTTYPHGGWAEKDLGEYKLTPGNYYYFKNWDVTPEARERGWQGENVIYLGEGKFYGHGIGLGDGEMFVNKLKSEMAPGGKTPSLLNLEAHLSTKLIELDLNPGQ